MDDRADSLLNALSGIGGAMDKDQYHGVSEPVVLGLEDLEVLFRHNHYARRIVNKLPEECTRRGWTITVDGETDDPYKAEFDRLQVRTRMTQADSWARLYGGSAMVLGVNDGQEADKEVDRNAVQGIRYIQVVDRHELTPLSYQTDFGHVDFGKPATYSLQPHSAGGASGHDRVVHCDRIVRFEGVSLPRRISQTTQLWGDSVIQAVYGTLSRFGMVEASTSNVVQEFTLAIWKIKGLRELLAGPQGQEWFMKRLVAANVGKSVVRAMVVDADKEEFARDSSSIKGLADVFDRFSRSLASAAEMPLTLMFGEAPAGLSTDDQAGRTYWYDQVASRQVNLYEPSIRKVCDLVRLDLGDDRDYTVKFHPLLQHTESELVEMRLKRAQTHKLYVEMGVLNPEEIEELITDDDGSLEV